MAKIENPEQYMRDRSPYEPWGERPETEGISSLPDECGSPPGEASLGRTGDWRVTKPVMPSDPDQCSRCCQCWMMCPEGVITLDENLMPHIDYEYCKGCMVCVEVCPRECITEVRETEGSGGQPEPIPTP
jgi:pyruvate ferredoxin oxidoreductase delta subunit